MGFVFIKNLWKRYSTADLISLLARLLNQLGEFNYWKKKPYWHVILY